MSLTAMLMAYFPAEQAADGRVPEHAAGPAVLAGADGEDPKSSDGGLAAVV